MSVQALAGTEHHAHARMVLGTALANSEPSHAYLFHGPPGTGKRKVARALAAELLAEGASDPENVRERVAHNAHPDLTWVAPSGAHVMRVEDVREPVILAATRTPFEASRRVFVLERVDTLNDEAANRLLKTLEEPASFVHLILLTDAPGQVLPTVTSRCQAVRFDPLPAEQIAAALTGIDSQEARACSRLALGNAERAELLASAEGRGLREDVRAYVEAALEGEGRDPTGPPPWKALLSRAAASETEALSEVAKLEEERLEFEPKGRERKALEREFEEAAKRNGRRARTEVLDLGLELAAISFRDLVCISEGADDAVLAVDTSPELARKAHGRDPRRLREAVERCEDTRLSLEQNVTEDLALEALGFRLEKLVGSAG